MQSMSAENRTANTARLAAGKHLCFTVCVYVCVYLCPLTVGPPLSMHSSIAPRSVSSRVHPVRSRRRRREVAEWSPLPGLSEHTQAHLWLPTSTDLWPVSLTSKDYSDYNISIQAKHNTIYHTSKTFEEFRKNNNPESVVRCLGVFLWQHLIELSMYF